VSEIRVDAIKTRAGAVPTANDLGLNVTGTVLQVVSAEDDTGSTTTSTSFQSTSVTASITPSSTSSKILIVCQVNLRLDTGTGDGAHMEAQIQRGGSAIGKTVDHGTREIAGTNNTDNVATGAILTTLDSPSTTSSTTYTVFIRALSTGVTAKINQGNSGSVITLMEIAG
jgi:hypothetical protein